jgi:hypothetical protein
MKADVVDGGAVAVGLLTLGDLMLRWQASGPTLAARRKWTWRRIHEWGVKFGGSRRDPRFRLGEVVRCEERHMGGGLR